jgi:galactokinase
MINYLYNIYCQLFGKSTNLTRIFFAPGRVNLIGEHIDYNGGYVLPCAINLGSYAIVSERSDTKVVVYSHEFSAPNELFSFDLNDVINNQQQITWMTYIQGVFAIISQSGYKIKHGLNLVIGSNLPTGAGLSSSASVQILIATIINEIFELNIDKIALVKLAQLTEHKIIGVKCGIMDQFACTFGEYKKAVLLKCDTLEYKQIDCCLEDNILVITNTNKPRKLTNSIYNVRVNECKNALIDLQQQLKVKNLCDIDEPTFNQYKHLIGDKISLKRAKHVITENQRTLLAGKLLTDGNLVAFANLMTQSHQSLRDDYQVSCMELDTLVDLALQHNACLGSRMVGAGFGGCTISIIKNNQYESFTQYVGDNYYNITKIKATFYIAHPHIGATELTTSYYANLLSN